MKRDFVAELKRICQPINDITVYEKLYNIHKRSLPAEVDKIVIMGVTLTEAQGEIYRLVKKEQKQRAKNPEGPIFYFDVVPMEATNKELDIFYNPNKLIS